MSSDNTGWQPPSDDAPDPGEFSGPASAQGGGTDVPRPAYDQYQQPAPDQWSPQAQNYGSGPQYGQYSQPAGAYPAGPGGFFAAPKPGIIPLRPLSITEIIGGAFESLRANPRAMFLPALIVMGASGLLSAALTFISTNSLFAWINSAEFYDQYGTSASDAEIISDLLSRLAGTMGSSVISRAVTFLATAVLTGLLIVTVSRSVLGRIASPAEVWERTRPRIWALIGQTILVGLITYAVLVVTLIGFMLLLVGGLASAYDSDGPGAIPLLVPLGLLLLIAGIIFTVFLSVRLSASGAALILENVGVWEGIRRSWRLTRGNFWHVFGTLLLAGLIVGVVSYIVGGVLGLVTGTGALLVGVTASALMVAVSAFLGGLIDAVIMPFSSAATALIYIDLRMRQEGLDMELRRSAGV